ncbi:flagellar export protein FliJ [Micromonospora echinofusca]|uniref:flagellar export protein FliJ n=1 Tax=Micromonospora echinofusca TaxID=47858 RepID=UPI0033E974DA
MSTTKTKTTRTKTATEQAAERLTEARALVDQRRAEREQAEETHAELIGRLTRGDASVTGLDLVTAEAEITRLGYLIEAARKAVKPAERALDAAQAIDSPTLARFIAERIEADPFAFGVYGLPVIVNADDRSKPGVYVNQANATTTDPATGIMSGRVGITVVTPNGSPVDGAAMLAGLAGIEVSGAALVTTHASPSPAGVTVDVRLSNVKPDVPTLPAEVDGNALRTFGLDLVTDIAGRGGESTQGQGNPLYEVSVKRIRFALDGVTVTGQERDADQERRTVRVVFDLASSAFRADQISEYTRTSVGNLAGEMAAGIGRVNAARVVSEKATTESGKPGQEFSNSRTVSVRVVVEVDAVARIAG